MTYISYRTSCLSPQKHSKPWVSNCRTQLFRRRHRRRKTVSSSVLKIARLALPRGSWNRLRLRRKLRLRNMGWPPTDIKFLTRPDRKISGLHKPLVREQSLAITESAICSTNKSSDGKGPSLQGLNSILGSSGERASYSPTPKCKRNAGAKNWPGSCRVDRRPGHDESRTGWVGGAPFQPSASNGHLLLRRPCEVRTSGGGAEDMKVPARWYCSRLSTYRLLQQDRFRQR